MEQNKTGRYLKYAFGEVVLVVIGILIALQINNWNERQKAKSSSFIYMNNLINDIAKDTLMYANHIETTKLKYEYSKEVREFINGQSEIIDTSAFIVELQSIGRLDVPKSNDNAFTDLISSGNLKLINDEKCIDAIRAYYVNTWEWWYAEYKNQLVNGYLPIVVDAIPMHLHEEIIKNEIANLKDLHDELGLENKVKSFTSNDVKEIMNALRGNKEFDFQLKRITRSHLVQIKFLSQNNDFAKSLLSQLTAWKTEYRN